MTYFQLPPNQSIHYLSKGMQSTFHAIIGFAARCPLTIYDEPTTGLHYVDIHKLLNVLNRLIDLGNTVIIIEHNLDVIKSADHIIDLGPEGGEEGGRIVAEGTPEEVSTNPDSYTGRFLRDKLLKLSHVRVA